MKITMLLFPKKKVHKFLLVLIPLFYFVGNLGGIPLPVFSEWWLSKQKFSEINSFILSSFRGARCQGYNGLSIRYQVLFNYTIIFLWENSTLWLKSRRVQYKIICNERAC